MNTKAYLLNLAIYFLIISYFVGLGLFYGQLPTVFGVMGIVAIVYLGHTLALGFAKNK